MSTQHPYIKSCVVLQSEFGSQYMMERVDSMIKYINWAQLYYKPTYVNLARVIKYVMSGDGIYLVTHYYDKELETLTHSQMYLFFLDLFNVIEYLAENGYFHQDLWNRHNIWIYKDRFYVKPFDNKPSNVDKDTIIRRCLKDVFILACNLLFNIDSTNFTDLEQFVHTTSDAMYYRYIYDEIKNFQSFNNLYKTLAKLPHPTRELKLGYVTLSDNTATRALQEVVLRSCSLTDNTAFT